MVFELAFYTVQISRFSIKVLEFDLLNSSNSTQHHSSCCFAEKTALLRPIELKLVPVALEGSAFRSKFLDTDELMSYCSWFATFSSMIPKWLRKTKIVKQISRILVNHLGLNLTKNDLQNVVDLMEPYGQISNGIEYLNPPLDVSN
ncbi:hypothetical protein ES332_D09G103700v1 [Gossypium tomentosum]|uniref:Uncharacterized protein n=1 Tax=Gossypium tomentosum TaxID=34277 RepID=A0A5D2JF68_GOSTO|nr:hypothetical protein ES332_D09G103700v1 [Gossypium tomentosum]